MIHKIKIPRNSIIKSKLIRAQGTGETIESMYSRMPNPKPTYMLNGGLYTEKDGWTLGAFKIDGVVIRPTSSVRYGYVLCGKGSAINTRTMGSLSFLDIAKDYDWAIEVPLAFPTVSGVPKSLLGENPQTGIGFDSKTDSWVIGVTDERPFAVTPLNFGRVVGADSVLLLDGGGSSKVLYKGVQVNKQNEKRKIATAIAIWVDEKSVTPEPPTQKKYKIALDAGHGNKTFEQTGGKGVWYTDSNGARKRFEEHHFNASVAKKAGVLAEYNGIQPIFTQPLFSDIDVPLTQRTNMARDEKVDLLISLHADASTDSNVRGHWNFFWKGHEPSGRLALIWDKHADVLMNATLDRNTRESVAGTWTEFHMCREPVKHGIPSILCENAFMTNAEDLKLLMSDAFQDACAEVNIRSACEFLGIPFKKPSTITEENNKDVSSEKYITYTVVKGDTLYKIATDHGVTTEQVRVLNNMPDNVVYIGTVMKIKLNPNYKEPETAQPPVISPIIDDEWKIKEGQRALVNLAAKGLVEKPSEHLKTMLEPAEKWLVFSLVEQLMNKK